MRVNFGCGERYAPGWTNVDLPDTPHPKDVALDIRMALPWGSKGVDAIDDAYLGHVLEHLYVDEVIDFLIRLKHAMVPNGEIMVVGPDVKLADHIVLRGGELEIPFESIRHGADRWVGDVHHWDCTADAIIELLDVTGWRGISNIGINNVPERWPVAVRGPQWQCAVSALAVR